MSEKSLKTESKKTLLSRVDPLLLLVLLLLLLGGIAAGIYWRFFRTQTATQIEIPDITRPPDTGRRVPFRVARHDWAINTETNGIHREHLAYVVKEAGLYLTVPENLAKDTSALVVNHVPRDVLTADQNKWLNMAFDIRNERSAAGKATSEQLAALDALPPLKINLSASDLDELRRACLAYEAAYVASKTPAKSPAKTTAPATTTSATLPASQPVDPRVVALARAEQDLIDATKDVSSRVIPPFKVAAAAQVEKIKTILQPKPH